MDKRTIENILSDQREELEAKSAMSFCRRMEEAMVDLLSTQAQVVVGVRRSGKSTLCYNVLRRAGVSYAYVNFDDERLVGLRGDELNDVLEVLYKVYGNFTHLFIDEIQNIPEWYLFVNRLLRRGMHIVVTGSNAKLLSGELATHLTGRHHSIVLYPFSFGEYCDYRGVDTVGRSTKAVAFRRAAFDDYLRQGGFPELQSVRDGRGYVDTLVDNILKRDIEQRFKIAFKAAFEQMANHLLNIAPAVASDVSLCELFGFKSEHTARNYVDYLRQAYLLVEIRRYAHKSRVRLVGGKVYAVDVALMNKRANAFAGENLGWRLETMVCLELLRRAAASGHDVYYYKDRSGECDFVVCRGREAVMAVQVSYDVENPKTLKRELAGLLLAARNTRCTNLLIVTDHRYDDIELHGYRIAVRPAYDWLVERA